MQKINDQHIKEYYYDSLNELEIITINNVAPINEMAIKSARMTDKYSEVISAIVDNLICICIYPDNPTVPHWRERAHALCKRFIDLDIEPLKKNTENFRYKCLMKGVYV